MNKDISLLLRKLKFDLVNLECKVPDSIISDIDYIIDYIDGKYNLSMISKKLKKYFNFNEDNIEMLHFIYKNDLYFRLIGLGEEIKNNITSYENIEMSYLKDYEDNVEFIQIDIYVKIPENIKEDKKAQYLLSIEEELREKLIFDYSKLKRYVILNVKEMV